MNNSLLNWEIESDAEFNCDQLLLSRLCFISNAGVAGYATECSCFCIAVMPCLFWHCYERLKLLSFILWLDSVFWHCCSKKSYFRGLTESAVSGKRHKLKDFFFWYFWKTTLCGFWGCNCCLPSYANQPCQSTKHLTVSLNCLQKVEFFMCKLMCCRLSISAVVMSYLQNPQPMSMPWWRQAMVFSPLFARHWYVYLW